MQLIRGLPPAGALEGGQALTVGTYDGLHLGHQALLKRLREHAGRLAVPTLMVTFEPMPREFLTPDHPPARLTSLRERWRCLEHMQLDGVCVLRFGTATRSLSADQFAQLLAERLRPSIVVVGHDFRFGKGGGGTAQMLQAAGQRLGFAVDIMAPVTLGGERLSSSAIREALAAGDLRRAERLLGRPYTMIGRVVRGEQLGRKLGFPTANLRFAHRRLPLAGIFAVRVRIQGADTALRGVASIGTRPTVGGTEPLLEVHIFDFAGDLYGREIAVECVQYLRPEVKFESLEAMVAQIHVDAAQARAVEILK
ncbi:MAG TPA: bifunctional riboflavin kinase/FAD synthetase [Steroidobacteraceae bacterium]|jgi:riboflavin kinase/FMN adenylyltransferase|nr:bifunctional riboflavin kinase/FAD synthetase [Steroidobacteraceae bacterium]